MAGKGKRGPAPKITPAIFEQIIAAVTVGGTQKQACATVGIAHSTLWHYLKANPKLKDRLDASREVSNFGLVNAIYSAAVGDDKRPPDLKAAQWLLSKRDPANFGRRDPNTYTKEQVIALMERVAAVFAGIPKKYLAVAEKKMANIYQELQADGHVAE